MNQQLPYFKEVLGSIEDAETAACFSEFIHWGYWDPWTTADTTLTGFSSAAERLTSEVCRSLDIRDGQRVLDVGSGFGGLAQHLGLHYKNISYVGVNFDQSQIDQSNKIVDRSKLESCEFIQADAISLPLASGAFDRVVALESIFHFSSRTRFLREARRVVASDGLIGCTDFVGTTQLAIARKVVRLFKPRLEDETWGPLNIITAAGYRKLAADLGLECRLFRDISAAVQPSYAVMKSIPCLNRSADFRLMHQLLDWASRLGAIRYQIYAWSPGQRSTSSTVRSSLKNPGIPGKIGQPLTP